MELLEFFQQRLKAMGGEIFTPTNLEEAKKTILKISEEKKPGKIAILPGPIIDSLKLDEDLKQSGAEIFYKNLFEVKEVLNLSITEVDYGIAQTGTLVDDSTSLDKRIATMMPETVIALLRSDHLTFNMAEAIKLYRQKGDVPSYLAFVTGPSRTADIERVLTIGVHGPKHLYVLVMPEEGENKNE